MSGKGNIKKPLTKEENEANVNKMKEEADKMASNLNNALNVIQNSGTSSSGQGPSTGKGETSVEEEKRKEDEERKRKEAAEKKAAEKKAADEAALTSSKPIKPPDVVKKLTDYQELTTIKQQAGMLDDPEQSLKMDELYYFELKRYNNLSNLKTQLRLRSESMRHIKPIVENDWKRFYAILSKYPELTKEQKINACDIIFKLSNDINEKIVNEYKFPFLDL